MSTQYSQELVASQTWNFFCYYCESKIPISYIRQDEERDGRLRTYFCCNIKCRKPVYFLYYRCVHCSNGYYVNRQFKYRGTQYLHSIEKSSILSMKETPCCFCHITTSIYILEKEAIPEIKRKSFKKKSRSTIFLSFLFKKDKMYLPGLYCKSCCTDTIWALCNRKKTEIICASCGQDIDVGVDKATEKNETNS